MFEEIKLEIYYDKSLIYNDLEYILEMVVEEYPSMDILLSEITFSKHLDSLQCLHHILDIVATEHDEPVKEEWNDYDIKKWSIVLTYKHKLNHIDSKTVVMY